MITNETMYAQALIRIEEIFNAQPGDPEFEELQKLVSWVEKYEERYTAEWEQV